uniref:Uncharacterized protein n=1 Tax=Schistosoma haematobium TaxID=6185 RepID=A0A094ZR15_SCHHA
MFVVDNRPGVLQTYENVASQLAYDATSKCIARFADSNFQSLNSDCGPAFLSLCSINGRRNPQLIAAVAYYYSKQGNTSSLNLHTGLFT